MILLAVIVRDLALVSIVSWVSLVSFVFPSIHLYRENGWMEAPPPPKRVSAGLPRRVLDVSMREFPSLFAGYKNVTHDVGGVL